MSADAMLEDTEDLHTASAVAAHLQALRHCRKRAHGSRVPRRPRLLDLYRAAGRISGLTFVRVCALF